VTDVGQREGGKAVRGLPWRWPPPRRLVFHVVLALWTSPFPGAVLIAGRLLGRRRFGAAAAIAALGAVWTAVGVLLGFGVAAPRGAVTAAVVVLWLVGGFVASVIEERAGLVPERAGPFGRQMVGQMIAWTVALPVGCVWLAVLLAAVGSRWSGDLVDKPSMPHLVLLAAFLVLGPVGMAWGFVRAALGRKPRPAPLVLFPLALMTIVLLMAFMIVGFQWLFGELFGPDFYSWNIFLGEFQGEAVGRAVLLVALLVFGFEVSEARGVGDFVSRISLATLLFVGALLNAGLVVGELPETVHRWLAEQASERQDHDVAIRHWDWVVRRVPGGYGAEEAIRSGVAEALLAGDAAAARAILGRTEELAAEAREARLHGAARAILDSPFDLSLVHQVEVRPVQASGALPEGWRALLTAVRVARPELSEADLERRLQELSSAWEWTALPEPESMDTVRVVADLFECEVLGLPFEATARALDAGFPVLFRRELGSWQVIDWLAEGADAVLWLEPEDLAEDEEGEDRERAEVLASIDGQAVEATADLRPRVRRLGAISTFGRRTAREGGLVFMLVPAAQAEELSARLELSSGTVVERALLERARSAFERGNPRRAIELGAGLPEGGDREELLAAIWLDRDSRELLPEHERARLEDGVTELLSPEGLGAASIWFVHRLTNLIDEDRDFACRYGRTSLEAWLDVSHGSSWATRRLLILAKDQNQEGRVSELAEALARRRSWSDSGVLEGLEWAVGVRGAMADPELRAPVERLVGRLDLLVGDGNDELSPRSAFAPYCAGRAILADDPDDRVEWARKARDLEPDKEVYHRVLERALEAAGRPEEARTAKRAADELALPPLCAADGAMGGVG